MSQLYNFEIDFKCRFTCTASSREEAMDKLYEQHGDDIDVTSVTKDEFDPAVDDYLY